MPRHYEHCEESLRQYGKSFSELHHWMDEPWELLGKEHRIYRHDIKTTPLEAKKLFGEFADHACIDHIRLDEKDTQKKRGWMREFTQQPTACYTEQTNAEKFEATIREPLQMATEPIEPRHTYSVHFQKDLTGMRRILVGFGFMALIFGLIFFALMAQYGPDYTGMNLGSTISVLGLTATIAGCVTITRTEYTS